MKNGDLVVKFWPVANHIANTMQIHGAHVERQDLRAAALDGLIDAAMRFRPELGTFNAFARQRIAGAIIDAVRHAKPMHSRELFDRGTYELGLGFDVPMQDVTLRETGVLHMLFTLDMTQAEVARQIDRAECRVFQIKRAAFAKIRRNLAERGITRLEQIL